MICALTGCSLDEDEGRGDRTSSPRSGSQSVAEELQQLTPVPEPSRPRSLAQRLEFLDSITRADARPADVRRAAELEQLASRTLGGVKQARSALTLRRLPPGLRSRIASDVAASRRLTQLVSSQPSLPQWRIVSPPRPERLLRAYRRAERATGVGWEHLAAIHLVETRMGRIRGVSTAGAQGPMQFIPPTWDIYGGDGDIRDPEDAILAAGRLLRANGFAQDPADAVWHYNQSGAYVFAVRSYARVMERDPAAYHRYWHWRVLYRYTGGTQVLPQGYPQRPAIDLERS